MNYTYPALMKLNMQKTLIKFILHDKDDFL